MKRLEGKNAQRPTPDAQRPAGEPEPGTGPKVRAVEIRACGCTVLGKPMEPARAAARVDVMGVLDRHAREILRELVTGRREGGAE